MQQILKFSTLEEVLERCNDTQYGLGSGVLTNSLDRALMFSQVSLWNEHICNHSLFNYQWCVQTIIRSQGVEAGSVWVNCYDATMVQTPFGGYKQSGHGREL